MSPKTGRSRNQKDRLTKLMNEGSDKVHKYLNIEKLIKNLKDMKILLKNQQSDSLREQLTYDKKNVIDLDNSESEGL